MFAETFKLTAMNKEKENAVNLIWNALDTFCKPEPKKKKTKK